MTAKITKFNTDNIGEVRTTITEILTKELAKHGLSANLGNIRYSDNDFKCQLTISMGSVEDAGQREWDKYAPLFGLDKEDFGTLFVNNGKTFEVTGIAPRSRKYPVLVVDDSGKQYKFSVNVLK